MHGRFIAKVSMFGLLAGATFSVGASEGDIDPSFGVGGVALFPPALSGAFGASGPLIQRDGKIVFCGVSISTDGLRYGGFVTRLNVDGSLDSSFGDAGRVELDSGDYTVPCPGFALQVDGKIVIASSSKRDWADPVTDRNEHIIRLEADGGIDASFGDGGIATIDFTDATIDSQLAMAIQPDGAIVVGIPIYPAAFGLVRADANGAWDSSFGVNGRVNIPFSTDPSALPSVGAILADTQNRVVVAGVIRPDGSLYGSFAAARVLQDGTVDSSFGSDGRAMIDMGSRDCHLLTALLQNDGRILLAGSATTVFSASVNAPNTDAAVARLLDNGTLDPSFGNGGYKILPIDLVQNGSDEVFGGMVRNDQRIVLTGTARDLYASKGLIVQLDPDGNPVDDFGSNGARVYDLHHGSGDGNRQVFQGVGVQGSEYVIVGSAIDFYDMDNVFVARLDGGSVRRHTVSPARSPLSMNPLQPGIEPRIRRTSP